MLLLLWSCACRHMDMNHALVPKAERLHSAITKHLDCPAQGPLALAQGAARDATIIACRALQLKLAVLSGHQLQSVG